LKDSANLARKISDFRELAVCSKKTAAKWAVKQPADLALRPYVAYRGLNDKRVAFTSSSKRRTVDFSSSLSFNITSAVREAVLEGNCFAILPDFTVDKDLARNQLVELLPKWSLRKGGIYIMSPPSRLRTQSVRLFLESVDKELNSSVVN